MAKFDCTIESRAQAVFQDTEIGPYDVHELLHEYHYALGVLPDHSLFASSMNEARRIIGDTRMYGLFLANMKNELHRLELKLANDKQNTSTDECQLAQLQIEEKLYLENNENVSLFYKRLGPTQEDYRKRISQMLYKVSGRNPEVRDFLVKHKCNI